MASASIFGFLAAFFAFSAGAFSALQVIAAMRRQRRRAAADWLSSGMQPSWASLARNGIKAFYGPSYRLLRIPAVSALFASAATLLEERDVMASDVSLCSASLALCMMLAVAGSAVAQSVLGGLACIALVVAVGVSRVNKMQEQRNDAIREAVPEVLQSMAACSHTGFTLSQMLEQVAAESPRGLRDLFEHSVHILQAGGTSSDALVALRKGSGVPELVFVSVALDVQHQAGGSLNQVLSAAQDMVESELELRRTLRVQTAQARLSARVVTVMPFAMIALLSLFSDDFLAPFFQSLTGVAVLVLALGMQLTGVLMVRRLLKVGD